MIHRMLTLPLNKTGKAKELAYIFETARLNGYEKRTIQAIIQKKEKLLHRKSQTTLSDSPEPLKRVSVPFDKDITQKLKTQLREFGLDLVFSSRNNQLASSLGSTKDSIDVLGRAGVYKIKCKHCSKMYVGQTKRTLATRFKEHLAEVTKAVKQTDKGISHNFKSTVAEHIFTENHDITTNDITILRTTSTPWKLDVAESLEINKQQNTNLLNKDQGNGYTWLFNLIPKRHQNRRSGTPAATE